MYRTIAQLDAVTESLAARHPQYFTRTELPERSVQGRPVYALRMRAGGGEDRRALLLIGGTHARELMNPDAIIELAVDMLASHANATDIVYGGRTWPASEVASMLETLDIWMLPCLNPDGRALRHDRRRPVAQEPARQRGQPVRRGRPQPQRGLRVGRHGGPDLVLALQRRLLRPVGVQRARDAQRQAPARREPDRLLRRRALVLGADPASLGARAEPDGRSRASASPTCRPGRAGRWPTRATRSTSRRRTSRGTRPSAARSSRTSARFAGASTRARPGSPCTRRPARRATTSTAATSPIRASTRRSATRSRRARRSATCARAFTPTIPSRSSVMRSPGCSPSRRRVPRWADRRAWRIFRSKLTAALESVLS